MAEIVIREQDCVGCGACVRSCPQQAISVAERKAVVDGDKCVLCGLCVDSCPFGAIALEKGGTGEQAEASREIWVFCEALDGEVAPVARELLGKGRQLADQDGSTLVALLFGCGIAEQANGLFQAGADEVILCDDAVFRDGLEAPFAELTARLIEERRPAVVLYGATVFGRSVAPRVAAKIGTGLTADCTSLEIDKESGLLVQTRPAFGGNLMASIICERHRPQMATVRPGVMKALESPYTGGERLTKAEPPAAPKGIQVLETVSEPPGESITDARVIVTAGRGIGSQKNMELVRELAGLLGGAVGVTRPLVDMGWSEYRHQIGQTGLSVSPDLMICLGVSGAIQHLAGISGAKTIVAVNSDAEAPIFSVAHYKVTGDCVEVLREMIAQLKQG